MYNVKYLLVLVFSGVVVRGQIYEGEECSFPYNRNSGTCTRIRQCPEALANLRRGINPVTCGFEGREPLVCCTNNRIRESKPKRIPGTVSKEQCRKHAPCVPVSVTTEPQWLHKFVVGGTIAKKQEFPHMVQIGYGSNRDIKWLCGGSLISPTFVLTAAHCIRSRTWGEANHARMGLTNQSSLENVQQFRIIKKFRHPDYSSPSHYNDIGLLQLDGSADISRYVRPACLYLQKPLSVSRVTATGWGKVEFAGDLSNDLLKVDLEPYEEDSCNQAYSNLRGSPKLRFGIQDDSMICAGSSTDLKDTCQGDSGGPLQITNKDFCTFDIIGITSFGKACGLEKDIPGVYTRVSNYIQWIEDIVWPAQ